VPEKPVPLIGKDRWRKLLEETQLIWPEPEPIGWQLAPFVTIAGPEPKPTGPALDYIEITQVTIQGQPYAIEPLYSDRRSLRLQTGQSYIPLQVVTDGGPYYALVRRQDHIDAAEQFAVMRGKDRVWTAHLPEDTSEAVTYTDRDIRIIGVIEAVLTPLHAAA
jgi:hypothetical protein